MLVPFQCTGLTGETRSNSGPTVAQTWRVASYPSDRDRPALDAQGIERLALAYVGRYASTRAKLRQYLARKLAERGWKGEGQPPVEAIVTKFAELGYVDDRAFADARAASLARRGYGARRVSEALRAAGIEEEDAAPAYEAAADAAWEAAIAFARRRRIGPFAAERGDFTQREKRFAAMLRAGHPPAIARRLVDAAPGNLPDPIS